MTLENCATAKKNRPRRCDLQERQLDRKVPTKHTTIMVDMKGNVNMSTIILDSLRIENFKGCRHLDLNFQGRSASIFGDNATGKTTVYDAFCWLLYGKDSKGRTDFQIKPLGADGQVADHSAVTSVEATMCVDGLNVALRKDYFERWSTKRGSATETYDGNTCEYYIDDVPLKKYEYESRISELCPEDTFRVLTSVSWFCEGLDWRNRRDMLFQICDLPDDKAIMAGDPRFSDLASAMGALSVDDYKRKLAANRKSLNADRNTIPARLDEQQKVVNSLMEIDFNSIRAKRDDVAAKMQSLQEELLRLSHGTQIDAKRNELSAAKNELASEINANNSHRQSQMIPVCDRRPELQAAIEKAKADFARWTDLEKKESDLISKQDSDIDYYRKLWAAVDAEVFTAESCPTCGQNLPEEAQKAAQRRFEAEKKKAKDDAVELANVAKKIKEAAEYRRNQDIEAAVFAENEVARLTAELDSYVPDTQPEITDLPGHDKRMADLQANITRLQGELDTLNGETSAIRSTVESNINDLRAEISALDAELAKESVLSFAAKRCDELRESAKKTAAELSALDKQMFLCEEYARYKVRFVEDTINSKFRLTRWKLFDEQVNGGLNDCCEATYDGVPYAALNNGMRINIGVDVISAIADHFGMNVPLVIDNAESVTSLMHIDTQVIRLVVSENDKELRVNYED